MNHPFFNKQTGKGKMVMGQPSKETRSYKMMGDKIINDQIKNYCTFRKLKKEFENMMSGYNNLVMWSTENKKS